MLWEFGQRAFSLATKTQWNLLAYEVRHSESSAFKTDLKPHLFRSAYFWSLLAWCGLFTRIALYIVTVCVCVCVGVRADPALLMFVPGIVCISKCEQCDLKVIWRYVFEYCCNCMAFCRPYHAVHFDWSYSVACVATARRLVPIAVNALRNLHHYMRARPLSRSNMHTPSSGNPV